MRIYKAQLKTKKEWGKNMKSLSATKKLLALLLCMAMLLCCSFSLADQETASETEETASDVPVMQTAYEAILYEESTGTVLFSLEPDKHNAPASMTKVMTAVLVLEYNPELTGSTVVSEDAVSPTYCSWMDTDHLYAGEEVTIMNLMKYLLIPSGNEAATTLAEYVAGDIPTFIDMMNEKAAELGMTNTHYEDPHGLSSDSYISVQDMLTLCRYAMTFKPFRNIVHMNGGSLPASNKREYKMSYWTSNRFLDPDGNSAYITGYNSDIIGIKTGTTPAAGYNLSSCMVKDDLTFYTVVMHCSDIMGEDYSMTDGRYVDTRALFDYARLFEKQGYAAGDTVCEKALWGSLFGSAVPLTANEDMYLLGREGEALNPTIELSIEGSSVKAGDVVGRVVITDEFGNTHETELIAGADASKSYVLPIVGAAVIIAIVVAIVLAVNAAKKRKAAAGEAAAEPAETAEAEKTEGSEKNEQ